MQVYIQFNLYQLAFNYMLESLLLLSFLLLGIGDGHVAAPDMHTGTHAMAGDGPQEVL